MKVFEIFWKTFRLGDKTFYARNILYDEESDHSNKAVRKTPEIESGHKVSEEVK